MSGGIVSGHRYVIPSSKPQLVVKDDYVVRSISIFDSTPLRPVCPSRYASCRCAGKLLFETASRADLTLCQPSNGRQDRSSV